MTFTICNFCNIIDTDMKSIENTIEYHELIMTLDDLNSYNKYPLPNGYNISFWKDENDTADWIDIHIKSGEFQNKSQAMNVFHDFYDTFYEELPKRCFFISNEKYEKIATATVSPSCDRNYPCVIDWLAITHSYQGMGLGNPLISQTLKVAKDLGYDKILLHTQTTTWLAAKLYLDFGFIPLVQDDVKGWDILKTLTNHPKLKRFNTLKDCEIYSQLMLNVKSQLNKLHDDFDFEVWYINNRNDVYVNSNGKYFQYKFFDNGNKLELVIADEN